MIDLKFDNYDVANQAHLETRVRILRSVASLLALLIVFTIVIGIAVSIGVWRWAI